MTLKHLRIYREVCRMESITKAAESLNTTQPAVSTAVRELESFYQVKLFERMNRKIYITEAGKVLLEYADSILSQFDESKDILRDIATSTRIRIGSNVSFGSASLPNLIANFRKLHPEIPIYTTIANSSQIEEALLRNELDFAIVDRLNDNEKLRRMPFKEDQMCALCSPDFSMLSQFHHNHEYLQISNPEHHSRNAHSLNDDEAKKITFSPNKGDASLLITLRDFTHIPLLLREPGSGSRDMLDKIFHINGITPHIALESISTQTLLEFCLRGQGVLFLSSEQAKRYIDSGQLIRLNLSDFDLTRQYDLIYHTKKYITKSMRSFIDFIQDISTIS